MSEIEGQSPLFSMPDVVAGEVAGEPSPARAIKVLDTAKAKGWTENPFCSLVLRLTRADAIPFFARWDLSFNADTGKKSWRFTEARAANGQPLNYNDIFIYLDDPRVIYPEPPGDELDLSPERQS